MAVLNINPIFVYLALFDYPIKKVVNKKMNAPRKTDSDFEQRGSTRRSVNIPCVLKIRDAVTLARLLDLSVGGAFVEFKGVLPVCGTEISLIFPIKGQKEVLDLDLKATVVYTGRFLQSFSNYYGCGVRFINVSCETAAMLEEFLKEAGGGLEKKYVLD